MVLDETMNNPNLGSEVTAMSPDFSSPDLGPQLALTPIWDDYSAASCTEAYGQEEGLPPDIMSVLLFDDDDTEEDDMSEDENFDDIDDDFDDDFDDDDDEDDFDDEDEDYEDEDEDYDYEEDVDYDDFDE